MSHLRNYLSHKEGLVISQACRVTTAAVRVQLACFSSKRLGNGLWMTNHTDGGYQSHKEGLVISPACRVTTAANRVQLACFTNAAWLPMMLPTCIHRELGQTAVRQLFLRDREALSDKDVSKGLPSLAADDAAHLHVQGA